MSKPISKRVIIFQLSSLLSILCSVGTRGEIKHISKMFEDQPKKHNVWPRGRIPYYIDDFSFDKVLRDRIRGFLEETRAQTGLQFVELLRPPAKSKTRWVLFINRVGQLGCDDYYTTNFTDVGVQRVVVGYDCVGAAGGGGGGGLAAAVLVLAGVPPQHNAPDRDEYIDVIQENILPDKKYLFDKVAKEKWLFNKMKYDFESASHYDSYKYTKNGQVTIRIKKQILKTYEESSGLSVIDIMKIKKNYRSISSSFNLNLCKKIYRKNKQKLGYQMYLKQFKDLAYFGDFLLDTDYSYY